MLKKHISNRAAALVILLALSATGTVGWKALDSREPHMVVHPKDYCVKCHKDPKTARRMLEKQGFE